jgi:hypothetical protein
MQKHINADGCRRSTPIVNEDVERDRAEFDTDYRYPTRRNADEHPEQAYRRGYQQGAHAVLVGLREAEALDPRVLEEIDSFIGVVGLWRYGRRALKRELIRDRAPRLTLRRRA